MTDRLRLGPLPKTETVRITIALPAAIKAELDRYAELFTAIHGGAVDAAALAPHMLAAFMERDRAFRKARQGNGATPARSRSASMSRAISSTSATAGDRSRSE